MAMTYNYRGMALPEYVAKLQLVKFIALLSIAAFALALDSAVNNSRIEKNGENTIALLMELGAAFMEIAWLNSYLDFAITAHSLKVASGAASIAMDAVFGYCLMISAAIVLIDKV